MQMKTVWIDGIFKRGSYGQRNELAAFWKGAERQEDAFLPTTLLFALQIKDLGNSHFNYTHFDPTS